MNNPIELPFQVSLTLGIVVFLLLRIYYFFRSRILRDFLPVAFENRWVRIFGIVAMLAWAAVVILWLVRADWLAWSAVALPEWLRWLGVVLMTTGLGLMTWAYETLGRSFHPMPDARAPRQLITTGPYRLMRHPMYAAILISSLAVCLVTANWLIFALAIPLQILGWVFRIPREEALMREEFGTSYLQYQDRTGRFFPRF